MSKKNLTKQALRKFANSSTTPVDSPVPTSSYYEGVSEGIYNGTSVLTYELSEVVVYSNSTSTPIPDTSPIFGGGIGYTPPINEGHPPSVTPPNTSPTLPNNGGAPYVPLSQSEKDKITNELKLDESGFEKMLGEIYFSPEIRKSPHIIGEVKLLYATSYTFRKFLMQYARGYYTLRFVVGDLGDGVFARTKPNDRAMTTEIILNRRYIVNGEFCPTPTMDNIGIIYNTDDPTYCTKAFASILVHEALHAQHFTILYDSIMRGIDSTQFYNYLISEGFSSEFADAFVRVYPNGLTKEEAENEFGNAMHEFMKKYCRTQIMRAAKDAMKIFKIVKWDLR